MELEDSEPPFLKTYKALFGDMVEEERTKRVHENMFSVDEYELPLVDLSGLSLGNFDREDCKKAIADAASRWGFFQVVNHGISTDILARMKLEQVKLFKQPFYKKANENVFNLAKNCYSWGSPTATSLMQFSWSEAFHFPLTNMKGLREFTSFSSPIEEYARLVFDLAQNISETLAEHLGCKSTTFFVENCKPSSCYLRMNRYPQCPISSKVFGFVPHTDSDFLTILYQDHIGGLQLMRDGEWISVKPTPDALIINIGDLFQAWCNGVYKSIEHRVVTNPEVERLSVAYFFCPSYDTLIKSYSEKHSIYKEFTFEEYRQQVQEDVKHTGSKIGLRRDSFEYGLGNPKSEEGVMQL
ncbi:unnamed protein product [Ilex paraguariensis]|uniref:Fe2OG dioxygenase domain-containing protein n=1 Tax=Ilex paraguariensis TaxID=185542 RepID=A0ABC8UET0_9AQUA